MRPESDGPAQLRARRGILTKVRRLLLSTLLAAALLLPASAQAAHRAPCTPGATGGPTCTWWDAKVTFIADGDTIDARIEGGAVKPIRFVGINAMELTRYSKYPSRRRGACHGLEATALIERAIKRSHLRVRLAAQHASSRSGHRLRRSVWVRYGGRWRDLARMQLTAGQALWLPNKGESAHDHEYARLASAAIAAQRNLYDPDFCGAGPDQDLPLSVVVNWDADGNDEANIDGEWADVRNAGSRPLSLKGWRFRDSALRSYAFPASASVPAHGAIRLRMGCGSDTSSVLHWCQKASVFENAGDGGYLYDPDGDVRASFLYPCALDCTDPLSGRVRVEVHPGTPESIEVVNTGATPADVSDHVLKLRNHGRAGQYVFGIPLAAGTVIAPGDTLTVRPPHADALANNGGVVELRTLTDVFTACAAWGFGRC
jgi:endonuclease YncB( thermonuclease family)